MNSAVSLCDLPATVVDLLGLSAGSPFPGRSLAAYWSSAGSTHVTPEMTTPAFSEQADSTALEAHPPPGLGFGGFQMSLVAGGEHYTRDGLGTEHLYDLTGDPAEMDDLMQRADAEQRVSVSRKRLLKFLTDNPASVAVEKAYLNRFRERLRAVVSGHGPNLATSSAE